MGTGKDTHSDQRSQTSVKFAYSQGPIDFSVPEASKTCTRKTGQSRTDEDSISQGRPVLLEIKDDVADLISPMIVEPLKSRKFVSKEIFPQKHNFFHDTTSERIEKQEKLLRDIFDHKVDKRTLTSITPLNLRKMVTPFKGKRALDDSLIQSKTVQEFQVFDRLAEGLMRIVFEEAMDNGFFGMLAEQKPSIPITLLKPQHPNAQTHRPKNEDDQFRDQAIKIPQQQETRKEVLLAKSRNQKRVWLVDIESRLKPNEQLTVLVVDDTENDRMVLATTILHDYPMARVDEAENGQAAFALVQEAYLNGWRYDLIFMDMNMPDFDGSVGISMIRGFEKRNKISKKTDICAVSGDDFEDTQTVDAGHIIAKVKKPVSLELVRWLTNKVKPA